MTQTSQKVSLPEGVSLQRVAQVLLDAWEAGSHQWTGSPLQLREGDCGSPPPPPVPQDTLDLFRVLHGQQLPYLLVGGIALLTYVEGRNTKDVDLLMSLEAMQRVPDLQIEDRKDCFVRARFRSVQVDLLLTDNPLFKLVAERFATHHRFAELEVPAVTVEGLLVLKLYALPSLYQQLDWDRVYVYESDIKQFIARYHPSLPDLFAILEPHMLPTDLRELNTLVSQAEERRKRFHKPEAEGL
jgi:hypothetical protein